VVTEAGAEKERDDPDEPGDGVGEKKKKPAEALHRTREISLKRKDGNPIRREEMKRDRAMGQQR
jgi:hypothetical protein